MSTSVTLDGKNYAVVPGGGSTLAELRGYNLLYVTVDALASAYRYNRLESLTAVLQVSAFAVDDGGYVSYNFGGAWVEMNGITGAIVPAYRQGEMDNHGTATFRSASAGTIRDILQNYAVIRGNINALMGGSALQLTLTLSDDKVGLTPICSPASGHVTRTEAAVLQWSFGAADSYAQPTQTAATVRWRAGSSGTQHTLSAGTAQRVTIPANTFPAGEVQWQVAVTASTGVSATSPWMSLSTEDGEAVAAPVSPVGEIIDGAGAAIFAWSHSTAYGTAQSRADLQISADGASWQTLATVTGAAQSYTAPAGSLPGGTLWWRVRTYNSDGAAGAWSEAAQFVVVAPPAAPVVTVAASPLPTVSWTATGQESYQVQLGPYDSGEQYGTARSWTPPDYLEDGSYTARVRVRNAWMLWSDWGAWAFAVADTPGAAITLTANAGGADVYLSWETTEAYGGYIVYRDGEAVARTTDMQWTDMLAAAGAHVYQVRGLRAAGMYTLSNAAEAAVVLTAVELLDVESGARVSLPMALAGDEHISDEREQLAELTHYSGEARPHAEIGPATERTLQLRPSFPAHLYPAARALEGLLGRLVHVRTPHGAAFYGILTGIPAEAYPRRRTYNLTIREVAYDPAQ